MYTHPGRVDSASGYNSRYYNHSNDREPHPWIHSEAGRDPISLKIFGVGEQRMENNFHFGIILFGSLRLSHMWGNNNKRWPLWSSFWEIQLVLERDLGRKEGCLLAVFRENYLSWFLMDFQHFNRQRRVKIVFSGEAHPQANPSKEVGKKREELGSASVQIMGAEGSLW